MEWKERIFAIPELETGCEPYLFLRARPTRLL